MKDFATNRRRGRAVAQSVSAPNLVFIIVVAFVLAAFAYSFSAKASPSDLQRLERAIWTSTEDQLPRLENEIVRVIQMRPHSVHAHLLLSQLYVRMFSQNPGELALLSTASDLAQQARELDPKSDMGYVALATVLDTMGNSERGLALLAEAQSIDIKPSWRYYFTRSRLVSEEAGTEEVLGLLNTALSFVDADKEIIVPYVVALLSAESSGPDLITKLRKWNDQFPSVLFDLTIATTLANGGEAQAAHGIYQQILAKDPLQKEALVNNAILQHRSLDQAAAGSQALEKILSTRKDLSPDARSMIYTHLGAAHLKQKQYKSANAAFVGAAKSEPGNLAMLDFMVSRYKEHKAHAHLVALIEELNVTTPGVGLLYALLGETLSEGLADHPRAINAFTNAIALEPSRSDYYNGMGLTYYRMSRYDSALRLFVAASEVNPNDATARYNEACVLAIMQRKDEALISLGDALSLDPQLTEHARNDQDFQNIRGTTQFQQMIAEPATLSH